MNSNLGSAMVSFSTSAIQVPSAATRRESSELIGKLKEVTGGGYASRVALNRPSAATPKSIAEELFDTLAGFKVYTASVAMHFDGDTRSKLFRQLDSLCSSDEWAEGDVPPELSSYVTLLRMLLFMKPSRRPGLAATSDGVLIASWTNEDARLTIECLPADRCRWIISRPLNGGLETAAGASEISRLPEVLNPYNPAVWFSAE